jgi:O-methyltransferase
LQVEREPAVAPKLNVGKWALGFAIGAMQGFRIPISAVPFSYRNVDTERNHYRPFFQPWRGDAKFLELWNNQQSGMLVETAYFLFSLAKMGTAHPGEIWECGVYRGATARLLIEARDQCPAPNGPRSIRLFDTFSGMPESRPQMDSYAIGSFKDTSLDIVKKKFAPFQDIYFHPGFLPDTFVGLEQTIISFAHIDVDQYESTMKCCEFIFPRLTVGGILVIDDYGRPSTVGARFGADAFFQKYNIKPVVLHTGQGIIIK